jgi:hypothetical protein
LAVAGFALAGFVHVFQPDPTYHGGLQQPAAVQGFTHAQQADPTYDGG